MGLPLGIVLLIAVVVIIVIACCICCCISKQKDNNQWQNTPPMQYNNQTPSQSPYPPPATTGFQQPTTQLPEWRMRMMTPTPYGSAPTPTQQAQPEPIRYGAPPIVSEPEKEPSSMNLPQVDATVWPAVGGQYGMASYTQPQYGMASYTSGSQPQYGMASYTQPQYGMASYTQPQQAQSVAPPVVRLGATAPSTYLPNPSAPVLSTNQGVDREAPNSQPSVAREASVAEPEMESELVCEPSAENDIASNP